MKKYKRLVLIIIGLIAVILIVISLFANPFLEKKIEAFLQNNMPDHIENSYESISVNVIGGTLTIEKPSLILKTKDSSLVHTHLKMKSFVVEDISYWDYLFNDEIHLDEILFEELQLTYYKDHYKKKKDTAKTKKPLKLPKPILIDNIVFKNSSIGIYQKSVDSTILFSKNINLDLMDMQLNETTLSQRIPVKFGAISATTDSIFLKVGQYENLSFQKFEFEDGNISLNGIQLKTKYSREELSKIIAKERDHFNVKVEAFKINNLDFGFENDTLYVKSNLITVATPDAAIYRDKLVADDHGIKKLYSESIRDLPIKLTIDSISMTNGRVEYSEKVFQENTAGVLTISKINAGISDISNTYTAPEKTTISVEAIFMKDTPITANWSFDTSSLGDEFTFKGTAGKMDASDMNVFTAPLLNAELEGQIHETIFSITGDYNQSIINLSQNYDDIKIEILSKKSKKRKKALSSIANVFVHDDSKSDGETFNNVTANVSRDKTKSFFNYLASNIKVALISNFTKKKNKKSKEDKRKARKQKN